MSKGLETLTEAVITYQTVVFNPVGQIGPSSDSERSTQADWEKHWEEPVRI